jgi:hypothetical protein
MTSSDDKGADVGPVSEATLMRFVDGDLPPREHEFVAGLIAAHPDASRSVLAYRFSNEELHRVYDVAMNVPAELIDRCLQAADRPSLRSRLPSWRQTALALAASIALLLVGAAGWVLREATHSNVANLGIAPPGLQRVLETTLAGNVAQLSGAMSAKVVATFTSHERRWCRQYAVSEDQQERAKGIACRHKDGWHIIVQAESRQAPTPGGAQGYWIPAGLQDPVASYVNEIMSGNGILGPEDEAQLIRNEHWKQGLARGAADSDVQRARPVQREEIAAQAEIKRASAASAAEETPPASEGPVASAQRKSVVASPEPAKPSTAAREAFGLGGAKGEPATSAQSDAQSVQPVQKEQIAAQTEVKGAAAEKEAAPSPKGAAVAAQRETVVASPELAKPSASALTQVVQPRCMTAGGWGTGAFEGFASFMAEAAMKNSAKTRLGDDVKIGAVRKKCGQKGLLIECTASAQACR